MKTTGKIAATAILASVMVNGIMTGFTFATLDIHLHDTYFAIDPVKAILSLTLGFILIVGLYQIVRILTDRYRMMAMIVAIINPPVALLLIIMLYNQVTMVSMNSQPAVTGLHLTMILFVAAVLCFQVIIEIRALRKVREFWN